jgi:hypothetical protein
MQLLNIMYLLYLLEWRKAWEQKFASVTQNLLTFNFND